MNYLIKKFYVHLWVKPSLNRRFKRMQENGCVDVKISLDRSKSPNADDVLLELYRLYKAIDRGACVPLNFNDSYTKAV
jgi:hypothetical protein